MILRILGLVFAMGLLNLTTTAQGFTSVERYTDLSELHAVNHIVVDSDDNKYVATDNGLYQIQAVTNQLETVIEGEAIQQLAWDSKSGLWATKNDSVVFQPFADRTFSFDRDVKITCIDATATLLYVGTNRGLYKVGLDDGVLEERRSTERKLLGQVPINAIFVDPDRIRWIGTDQGVFRIDGDKLNHYEKKSKITAFTYTYEGVWIVSEGEMWLVDQYNRWAPAAVKRDLSSNRVRALAADKRAQIYLASDILVQFNPYTDEAYQLDESYGFVNSQSTSLVCDAQDQVWVGTASRGLYKIDIKSNRERDLTAIIVLENDLKCADANDASLLLKIAGVAPYRIDWSIPGVEGENPTDLGPGEYRVTIIDSLGREFKTSTTIQRPTPITISVLKTIPTSSKSRKNGKAEIAVSGGTPPYQVRWSGGQVGTDVQKLASGPNLVTVVDANDCIVSTEVVIEEERLLAGVSVEKLDVGTTINIEKVYFDADSTEIKPSSYAALDEIFDFLVANDNVVIEIGGHTNSIPPDDYCDRLSTNRARSVANYLYAKGITEERIAFKGYGKRNPIATNETRAGRQKNQRVEIKVLSLGG